MTALCPDPAELSLSLLECCSPSACFLARQSFGESEFLSVQDSTQAELYRIHMNAVQLSVCVIDS